MHKQHRVQIKDISDEEIYEAIRRWQALMDTKPREAQTPDVALSHKYPEKLILAKMQRMVEQRKLDYGVSLRTAWIVDY